MGASVTLDARSALKALDGLSRDLAGEVINSSVERLAKNVFAAAFEKLSGDKCSAPGSYPVPVRTGHLRRSLFMVLPGGKKSKAGSGGDMNELKTVYDLKPGEAYVGNSAAYALAIHQGRIWRGALSGGRGLGRPFLTDAGNDVLGRASAIVESELAEAIKKHGLN